MVGDNHTLLLNNRTMSNQTDNTSDLITGQTDIETLSKNIMFWSLSFIIPVGLLFNVISVPVFMSKPLRRRSASWYLAALAVADSVTLLTCCFEYWMKDPHIGIPIVKVSSVLCIGISHLSYASRLFSAVLITSFTVERFICVVAPLRRAALSKPGRARRVIALQCLLCIICTSFVPFTMEVNEGLNGREPECDVRQDRYAFYLICTAIFLLFGSIVIPIIVIFTLNTFIMKKVCMRRSSLAVQNSNIAHMAKKVRRKSFNTASILLTVSTSFVILNIPYCISFLLLFFYASNILQWEPQFLGYLFAAKYITSVPYYLNYCINFLLYNVCARAFRVEIARMTCSTCRRYDERRMTKRRSPSLSRPTHSDRVTGGGGGGGGGGTPRSLSRRMCNQFFIVPHCSGAQDTTSFTSNDPLPPCPITASDIERQQRERLWKHYAQT